MSRLSNPGCMLRATCALFGSIFLPVGISFFFVLHHRHWLQGVGAVAAALGFYFVAWRGAELVGMDEIVDTSDIILPDLAPTPRLIAAPDTDPPTSDQEPST